MEEADGIIIENLRKIGCDIEDEVTSLAHFTTELVIEGAVRCITSIKPDLHLNHRMPPNLPARYKLCMDMASACKDIGYKGDLGYETFLHGSHAEIRNVFITLIQKLPKVNQQPIPESFDPFQQLLMETRKEILSQLHKPWLPYFCRQPEKRLPFQSCDIIKSSSSHGKSFPNTINISTSKLVPSLLEKNSFELAAEKYGYKFKPGSIVRSEPTDPKLVGIPSRFTLSKILLHSDEVKRKSKPALPPKPTNISGGKKSEIHQPTKEEQQQELSTALEKLEDQIQMRGVDLQTIEEEVSQMKETIKMKETALDAEGKELDRKEKLYSLLPDAPAHMDRMKKLLESNQQKMAILEQEWLEIKQPLEDEYQNWLSHHKNSLAEQLKGTLDKSISTLRATVEEIRTKEDLITTLQTRLDALPLSSLPRTFYTQRILSIVANVKKQNEEMHRVLEDVKSVQREINSLEGKVERTFTVTDEMIFKLAKTDEAARRIYKYLLSLHSDCGDILQLVKESGVLSREIKDLEEQTETEVRKNIGTKLNQMRNDLEQIRIENQMLEKQVYKDAK